MVIVNTSIHQQWFDEIIFLLLLYTPCMCNRAVGNRKTEISLDFFVYTALFEGVYNVQRTYGKLYLPSSLRRVVHNSTLVGTRTQFSPNLSR